MANLTMFSDTMSATNDSTFMMADSLPPENQSPTNDSSVMGSDTSAGGLNASLLLNFSLPPDMVFGEAHVIAIVAYSLLFLIGVTTNVASLRYVNKYKLQN
jgi:hypothetical protein